MTVSGITMLGCYMMAAAHTSIKDTWMATLWILGAFFISLIGKF